MQCNLNNVTRISGYNQAARYFEETKKPRSVKWGEDERPLYNTASHHYRIVKGEENGYKYYDLVLYSTPMIRYYQPNGLNEHRVLVRGHSSTASRAFVWRHGMGMGKPLRCVDGNGQVREGKLLLNPATHNSDTFGVPYNWSADMVFLGDPTFANLDLTRSRHIPIYKAATSDEDKWARKKVRTLCDHWIELLGYRLDEYLTNEIDTNMWQKKRAGESFTSALDLLSWKETHVIRDAVRDGLGGDEGEMDGENFVNAMTKLGHAVATHLKGVRENQRGRSWDRVLQKYVWEKELQPVTRADFRKSMESHLISLLNLRTGSARVDIGQFPESIPRRWWC